MQVSIEWLAGFFDGEGCIYFNPSRNQFVLNGKTAHKFLCDIEPFLIIKKEKATSIINQMEAYYAD